MEKLAGSSPDVHIGSLISLTSKGEIRYEGALHTLDTAKSTIVLKDVHSFGTEGRGKNRLHICPGNKVYEFIIFRDTDIKDLSVLSPPGRYDVFTNNALGAEHSYRQTLGTVLGLPVLPYCLCTQEFTNWWQSIFSPAASSSNTPLSSTLSFVCTNVCTDLANSFSSLSLQGNHCPVFLPKFEQVSTIASANGCKTQTLQVQQHLPYQDSTSGKWLIPGCVVSQSKMRPKRGRFHIKPLKVQPLLQQQPLLPLPVSESEHLRLIRESMCLANPEHMRRAKVESRGRVKGVQPREGTPSQRQHEEASCCMGQISEEFDLKAMNEEIKKKELWHDLHLNDEQATTADGNKDNTSEEILHKEAPSRKLLFVEDFFDLLPSRGDDNFRGTGAQATKVLRQREIDLETFGVVSRQRRRRRNGPRKKVADTTPSNSERNGCH